MSAYYDASCFKNWNKYTINLNYCFRSQYIKLDEMSNKQTFSNRLARRNLYIKYLHIFFIYASITFYVVDLV